MDDRLHDNGKVWSLSDKEFRVWIYSVSYCNSKRDKDPIGFLTQDEAETVCRLAKAPLTTINGMLRKRPPRDTSFWEPAGAAYVVHDFPEFGPKLDLTAAERQARHRDKTRSHAINNGVVTRDRHAEVTHPVPVPCPVPHDSKERSVEEHASTANHQQPIEQARELAIPKPGVPIGSRHAAVSAALVLALGCDVPSTRTERTKWFTAVNELVTASPPVEADEIPTLVAEFGERNTFPCTPRGIAGQLGQLRGPRPIAKPRSSPNGRRTYADPIEVAKSQIVAMDSGPRGVFA